MGLMDYVRKKKEEIDKKHGKETVPEGKYSEPCALCGGAGTDKKWAGQYWHKKCMRQSKKAAKGMF